MSIDILHTHFKSSDEFLLWLVDNAQTCPGGRISSLSLSAWREFISRLIDNHVPSLSYHLITCPRCKRRLPRTVASKLKTLHLELIFRNTLRKKVLSELLVYTRRNGIPILLLKEFPTSSYIPLQFDIDIFTPSQESILPLSRYFQRRGYVVLAKPTGWPTLKRKYYTQTKFMPRDTRYPQIEIRSLALTLPPDKKGVLTPEAISHLTDDMKRHMYRTREGKIRLPLPYALFLNCLIYYFEDALRSLHNLYRIHLLLQTVQSKKELFEVLDHAKPLGFEREIIFVFLLCIHRFHNPRKLPYRRWLEEVHARQSSLSKLTLRLSIRCLDFDHYTLLPEKNSYMYFLVTWLLTRKRIVRKILFFTHPKRLFFLIRALVKLA